MLQALQTLRHYFLGTARNSLRQLFRLFLSEFQSLLIARVVAQSIAGLLTLQIALLHALRIPLLPRSGVQSRQVLHGFNVDTFGLR